MNQQETEEYIRRIYLMGDHMIVRKCGQADDLGDGTRGIDLGNGKGLELPANYHEQTNFCELVDIGDGCSHFAKDMCVRQREWGNGETIWVPEQDLRNLQPLGDSAFEYWVCREKICPPFIMRDGGIHPLGDMVVLKLDWREFDDGVRLPDANAEWDINIGRVLSVGPEKPCDCDIGDNVVFNRRADVFKFRIAGALFGICSRESVVGVLA